MDIINYNVKLLSLKEICSIIGGAPLPEAVMSFIESSRKISIEAATKLPFSGVYLGPELHGTLGPALGSAEVSFRLFGTHGARVMFEGPQELIKKYTQETHPDYAFEIIKNTPMGTKGQANVEGTFKFNNKPSTHPDLVLRAITPSEKLHKQLSDYVMGQTGKLPTIEDKDLHPYIKKQAMWKKVKKEIASGLFSLPFLPLPIRLAILRKQKKMIQR